MAGGGGDPLLLAGIVPPTDPLDAVLGPRPSRPSPGPGGGPSAASGSAGSSVAAQTQPSSVAPQKQPRRPLVCLEAAIQT
eukprot:510221-Pyramimonas_sp.AAC.1